MGHSGVSSVGRDMQSPGGTLQSIRGQLLILRVWAVKEHSLDGEWKGEGDHDHFYFYLGRKRIALKIKTCRNKIRHRTRTRRKSCCSGDKSC